MVSSRANKGLATPVALSVLLFSFTILAVTTYSFALSSVNGKAGRLNYAAAKQDMLMLENRINAVTWSPGSSAIQIFAGYGGEFETKPELRRLAVNFTVGSSYEIIFNSTVGYVRYELPSVDFGDVGAFLRGDDRTVVNQSYAGMPQMYIRTSGDYQEIYLGYRPLAVVSLDTSDLNTVNVVRLFLVNLNSSQSLLLQGGFRVRVRCLNVTSEIRSYNFTGSYSLAGVKVSVEGDEDTVYLPLSSSGDFTLVRMEILICNVRLEEVSV